MRGNAVRKVQKPAQPSLLVTPVKLNVFKRFRMRQHGANRDRQDIDQTVLNLAWLARLFDRAKACQ